MAAMRNFSLVFGLKSINHCRYTCEFGTCFSHKDTHRKYLCIKQCLYNNNYINEDVKFHNRLNYSNSSVGLEIHVTRKLAFEFSSELPS